MEVALQRVLLVCGVRELGRERKALVKGVRSHHRRETTGNGIGERGGFAEPPGRLECLCAQRSPSLLRYLVSQRAREPGEHAHAQHAVLIPERLHRLFEERDQIWLTGAARKDESPAVAKR